jgi:hypothetical protein
MEKAVPNWYKIQITDVGLAPVSERYDKVC